MLYVTIDILHKMKKKKKQYLLSELFSIVSVELFLLLFYAQKRGNERPSHWGLGVKITTRNCQKELASQNKICPFFY